ncbi:MAG: hypothetical protein JSU04_08635 [Bdellovibrionales bacterium]|nr:hypothetical protein [Bdellovibrionales bacterium]
MTKFKMLLGLLLGSLTVVAVAEVKPLMNQMFNEIFTLKPFIVSETAFSDPKNAPAIDKSLKHMIEVSKSINHETQIKRSGFEISGKVLSQQLKEVDQVFLAGNKDYSLWMLKSTLSVCMNCHTQLPAMSTHLTTLNQGHILTNPFEEAEFLFVIRNFDEAMKLYQKALDGYPANQVTVDSLEKTVTRQLFYFVRVRRSMDDLAKALEGDLKNSKLPKSLHEKIEGLKSAALKMKKEKYPEFSAKEEADVRKYVESNLKEELNGNFSYNSPERQIQYLKISSILYEYLQANPGTHIKPDILYWLSFCEARYSHQLSYSMPELYLKQCVLEFPKNPIAKKCLADYQELVTMAYTGTSGTHIPAEVAKELKTMEELVKKVD